MTTKILISYLMMRDALHSDRKKDVAKFFIEYAYPEVKMKCDIITENTSTLLAKQEAILDGTN